MNGGHDLGGMHGLGPINPEPEATEPWFHAEWERRVLAMTLATGFLGQWNIDISRHARERQHPADYLKNTYYENWMAGLEKLLVEFDLVTENELASGEMENRNGDQYPVLKAERVAAALAAGGPSSMDTDKSAAFRVGDRVRVKNINPTGHTRAPRYTRGHVGTVTLYHGPHVFADDSADGNRHGEHLYTVTFDAQELWGSQARAGDTVTADLWDPHLEPA